MHSQCLGSAAVKEVVTSKLLTEFLAAVIVSNGFHMSLCIKLLTTLAHIPVALDQNFPASSKNKTKNRAPSMAVNNIVVIM